MFSFPNYHNKIYCCWKKPKVVLIMTRYAVKQGPTMVHNYDGKETYIAEESLIIGELVMVQTSIEGK